MVKFLITLGMIAALPAAVAAQLPPGHLRVGLTASGSIITGTPERPAPQNGEHMTGAAGPHAGRRFAATLEAGVWHSLSAVLEVFDNRLTTTGIASNCIHDDASPLSGPDSKICYLAASEDRSQGALIGPRVSWEIKGIPAYFETKIGIETVALTRSPTDLSSAMDYSTRHVGPVYNASMGARLRAGRVSFGAHAGFEAGWSRGSGTAHFPIGLGIYYDL